MLVLGAIIGKIFGECLDLFATTGTDFTVHWIVLGMAAYFVAVVRAPITGVILILENDRKFSFTTSFNNSFSCCILCNRTFRATTCI